MKMATVDNMKLVIELIYGDHYLKTYIGMRFLDLHIKQPIDKMVKDFAEFRNSIVEEKVKAGIDKDGKPKIKSVTRTIDL